MQQRIIECVPNISEGRDRAKIDAIAAAAESVEGVRLLDIDPGKATNRTSSVVLLTTIVCCSNAAEPTIPLPMGI